MGKIEITGHATRRVQCDAVELIITFDADAKSSRIASKQVLEQCELFLEKVEELGIDISKIRITDDSAHKHSYRDNNEYSAERTITLKTKFDMILLIQLDNC